MADIKAILAEIKQPLWDNWYIVEEIGSGASGVVYRIEAKRENRTDVSALKVEPITLDEVLYSDEKKRAELLEKKRQAAVNETSIMYNLKKCPYIVGYEDENILKLTHTDGYVLLIRMEYLNCLQSMVKKGQFDRSESNVIKLASEIGKGLQAAHKIGVIHRDVKPANFFVSDDGTFKLGDFNISKTSVSARSFAGTEGYIAPEIYKAKQSADNCYTAQADIYSFGICLYQLMNEYCFPFEENCLAEEAIDRRMNGEVLAAPKNASPEFARIILRACAYNLKDRYQNMDEMLADLERFSFSMRNGSAGSLIDRKSEHNPFIQPAVSSVSDETKYIDDTDETEIKTKKKKSKLPMIIALVAVIAVGGVMAGVLLNGGKKGKEKKYPVDAVEYEGHHYKYFGESFTWKNAEAFCVEQGGHLASINSRGEQKFITDLTENEDADNIWIGGYRLYDDEDTWYWTDDSKFSYTNWDSSGDLDWEDVYQPDNAEGNEYYIRYSNRDIDYYSYEANQGGWNDTANDGDSDARLSSFGFVCEWE